MLVHIVCVSLDTRYAITRDVHLNCKLKWLSRPLRMVFGQFPMIFSVRLKKCNNDDAGHKTKRKKKRLQIKWKETELMVWGTKYVDIYKTCIFFVCPWMLINGVHCDRFMSYMKLTLFVSFLFRMMLRRDEFKTFLAFSDGILMFFFMYIRNT